MKKWILIIGSSIILALGIFFSYPAIAKIASNKELLKGVIILFSSSIVFIIALYLFMSNSQRKEIRKLSDRLSMWTKLSYHVTQVGDEVFNELPIGILAYDGELEIKWANPFAKVIFDKKIIDQEIEEINEQLYNVLVNEIEKSTIQINNKLYDIINKVDYNFIYLFDVTDREKVKNKYNEQLPAMGIIYLDNFDESMASLDVSEQSSIKGEYLAAIDDWLTKYDGYLKPYSEDRLIFLTYRRSLEEMMVNKFDILETIRQISEKHTVRISLSIGVASWDVKYDELGVYAQNAIDLAEKRGGDQVVVNIENRKIEYFGAKLDASAKSSRVGARINAQTIKDYIKQSSKVYIMGHNQTDLDAFGAMLATYHMAKVDLKHVYKVYDYDKLDSTVQKVINEVRQENPNIINDTLNSEEALKAIDEDTLLIVVDTQSPKMVISQDLLNAANKVIIIDHHRISDEGFDAIFSYVEPSASSAIELVMELISFYDEKLFDITPLEASIMFGGLVLDTNNFTNRTGVRTFEVAHRLKELGADPGLVKMWLRRDLNRTLEITKLISTVDIYMEKFAFMVSQEIKDDRILLAQTSDEALLIDGIEAAFTIANMSDGRVGVSARSTNNINVQLIMEYIGGGGHLNSAAAQVKGKTKEEVILDIKEYIKLEYSTEGEEMEVILLEDIKGKGKKDQIIKVAGGYGNFLVREGKAIIADEESVAKLEEEKKLAKEKEKQHLQLMKKLKNEIESKKVTMEIKTGQDGKLFGSITTKAISEAFEEQNGILLDRKKIDLTSEINSVGIYTATITLHKDVKASFEIHVIEKQG